jgi:hypothetical protein
MAGSNRLLRRNGVWYYRRRAPLRLVEDVGKRVVQYSLKTTNLKEAKRHREVADIEWSARFAAAENSHSQISEADTEGTAKPKRSSDLAHLVVDYVARIDARIQQRIAEDPPESEAQRAELIQDTEVELQILGNRDDPRAFEYADGTVRRILGEADIVLD